MRSCNYKMVAISFNLYLTYFFNHRVCINDFVFFWCRKKVRLSFYNEASRDALPSSKFWAKQTYKKSAESESASDQMIVIKRLALVFPSSKLNVFHPLLILLHKISAPILTTEIVCVTITYMCVFFRRSSSFLTKYIHLCWLKLICWAHK